MKIILEDLKRILSDSISLSKSGVKLYPRFLFLSVVFLFSYVIVFLIDQTVRDFFSKIHTNYFDFIFNVGHFYGKLYLTLIFFIALYLVGLIIKSERIRKNGLRIFEAFIFSGIIVTILKALIGRWRPYTGNGNFAFAPFNLSSNDHFSLPSGDVAIAFAFSTVASSFFENKYWKVFCYSLASLTFIGRIYHDQHWLSDVILGAFISTTISVLLNNGSGKLPMKGE